ncbi:hypothetical protein B0I35DRAFT_465643 [Stachybotrys elegans]|uniref:Zn(2)-C6 fungal-type domain-containing protein n=1 Tax=Stachybotrys elegans TaxID=80388 RepID=A0A8K0WK12_9HYPO|nr:hypothetical protein B0I35DRAFT_465643 [Stachybotrys elegans]
MAPRRSSRPKVRTGCRTCRIRRTKCDEGKPSCQKCVSSGRVCDGYETIIRIVNMDGAGARVGSAIRPPPTSIDGTEAERRFFFNCRRAIEGGVALHICNVSSFWTRLAPQLSHHDEAVKHALVALGAAHQLYRVTAYERSNPTTGTRTFFADRLDVFLTQQYNKAISILCRRLAERSEQSIESTTLTLVCCLAFICLESLRANYRAAITHLQNGLRVIESSIDLRRLHSGSSATVTKRAGVSDADLREIVIQFRSTELCIHCFSGDVPMTLGSKFYRLARSSREEITPMLTIQQCHEARIELASDIMSRDWELRHRKGDARFWSFPELQSELATLRQRGLAVSQSINAFLMGHHAPTRGTWDYYSTCMDMLHVTCVRAVVELMPFGQDSHERITHTRRFQDEFVTPMAQYGAAMHEVCAGRPGGPPPDFSLETAIIGPMYWAYVYSTVPRVRATVLRILGETRHREGPWDAGTTLKLLGLEKELGQEGSRALRKWGAEADCYEPLCRPGREDSEDGPA